MAYCQYDREKLEYLLTIGMWVSGVLLSNLGVQLEVLILGLRDGGGVCRVRRRHVAQHGVEALAVRHVLHCADQLARVDVRE